MAISAARISELIIEQLARREMRVLSLTVAIRTGLGSANGIKGDLGTTVKSALRNLVASKAVVDNEGTYALATPASQAAPVIQRSAK